MDKLTTLDIQYYWASGLFSLQHELKQDFQHKFNNGFHENVDLKLIDYINDYFFSNYEKCKSYNNVKNALIELGLKIDNNDKYIYGTISKLQHQLSLKDREISTLRKHNDELMSINKGLESNLKPLQESINKLTAENSRFLRKLKRENNKL